jgi:hypothetical protein
LFSAVQRGHASPDLHGQAAKELQQSFHLVLDHHVHQSEVLKKRSFGSNRLKIGL